MSAGTLVGALLTLFGALAGAALIAAGIDASVKVSNTEAWIIFLSCFTVGVVLLLMFGRMRHATLALGLPGAVALLMGVVAGVAALAKTLGLMAAGPTASLWLLCGLTLTAAVILLQGAASARGLKTAE